MEINTEIGKKLQTEFYMKQREEWPYRGKHILAQYDEDSIVVYQAFKPSIAKFAVDNQKFEGCPDFNLTRMTWIKTNFLWMMYRCGWCEKHNQERVLAIWLKRDFFERILEMAAKSYQNYSTKREYMEAMKLQGANMRGARIRLQWDPDHYPSGTNHPYRKAIQLGLKKLDDFANGNGIVKIQDITDIVESQRQCYLSGCFDTLIMPKEEVYKLPEELGKKLGIDNPLLPVDSTKRNPKGNPKSAANGSGKEET